MKQRIIRVDSCACINPENEGPPVRRSNLLKKRSRIDKLYHGKILPLQEKQLIERLVRARIAYNDVKNKIIQGSNAGISGERDYENDTAKRNSEVMKIVDLVDKGKLRPSSEDYDCCDCCLACSKTCVKTNHSKRHNKHQQMTANELMAPTSGSARRIRASIEKGRTNGVHFQVQRIRSNSCECVKKVRSALNVASKSILKKVRSTEKGGIDPEPVKVKSKLKKVYCSCKISKLSKKSRQKIKRATSKLNEGIRKSVTSIGEVFRIKKDSIMLFKDKLKQKRAERNNAGDWPPELDYYDPDSYCVPDDYCVPNDYCVPDEYCLPDDFCVPDNFSIPDDYISGDYGVPDDYCVPDDYNIPDDYCVPKTCYQKIKADYKKIKQRRREKPIKEKVQSAATFTVKPKTKNSKTSSINPNINKKSNSRNQTVKADLCICEPYIEKTIPSVSDDVKEKIKFKSQDIQMKQSVKSKSKDVNFEIQEPHKQAIKISSSFIFEIEFYKKKYPKLTSNEIITNVQKKRHKKCQSRLDANKHKDKEVLLPKECEAGICLPSELLECDLEECSKTPVMKSRVPSRYSQCSSVCLRNKSVASSTLSRRTTCKSRRVQSNKLSKPEHHNKSYTIVKQNPLEESSANKLAIRVSSSFSFNIELNRDKKNHDIGIEESNIPYQLRKDNDPNTEVKKNIRNRHKSSQSKQSLKDTRMRYGLKRCFCTLKLQKNPRYHKCRAKCTNATPTHFQHLTQSTLSQTKSSLQPFQYAPYVSTPRGINSIISKNRKGSHNIKPCCKKVNTIFVPKYSKPSFTSELLSKSLYKKNKYLHELQKKWNSITLPDLRISSSCSLDIEFCKDRSQPIDYKPCQDTEITLRNDNPVGSNKIRRKEQGIKIHKSRVRHKISHTNKTVPESLLKRCFCSLKLFKTTDIESKHNRGNSSPVQHNTQSFNTLQENRLMMTDEMNGACKPYKCRKRQLINYNKNYIENSNTRRQRMQSASSGRSKLITSSKNQKSQSYFDVVKCKNKKTTNIEPTSECVSNSKSNKKAIIIRSNCSFHLELYKNAIPENINRVKTTQNFTKMNTESCLCTKHKLLKSGFHDKELLITGRSQHKSFDAHRKKKNNGIHIGSVMKKCFCILKLHKSGNDTKVLAQNNTFTQGTETPKSFQPRRKRKSKYKLNPAKNCPANSMPCIIDTFDRYEDIKRREGNRLKRDSKKLGRAKATGDTESIIAISTHGAKNISNEGILSRQGIRFTSNFNLGIEFSKNGSSPNNDKLKNENLYTDSKRYGIVNPKTKSQGLHTNNNIIFSQHTSQVNKSENRIHKASNVGFLLKRCFCTLKLHSTQNQNREPCECADNMRINELQKTKGRPQKSGTEKPQETKSIMTRATSSKSKKVQSHISGCTPIKHQSKHKRQIERNKHSLSSSAKPFARIGSSFNFDVELSKNKVFRHLDNIKTKQNKDREYQVGFFKSEAFHTKRSPFYKNIYAYNVHEIAYTVPHKLEKYECEPGVCVPYHCDPIECEKRIRKRLNKHRTVQSTTNFGNKSISTIDSKAAMYAKNMQTKTNRSRGKISNASLQSKQRKLKNTSNRESVRVGSTFSFDVEFFKERNQHLEPKRKVKTSSLNIKHGTKKKHAKKYRNTGSSRIPSRYHKGSQNYNQKTHRSTEAGSFLKRCFCTLKLRRLQNQNKRIGNTSSQFEGPNMNNISHRVSDANTMTRKQKIRKIYSHSLEPYECIPNTCVPGECNPYECEKRLKRYKELGVGAENHRTKSASSITRSFSRKNKSKKVQYTSDRKIKIKHKNYDSKRKLTRSKQKIELEPHRQAVRIGSSFSFNIELFKDSGNTEVMKMNKTDSIVNKHPTTRRNICEVTNCPHTFKNKCLQDKRCNLRNSEMQALANETKTQKSMTDFTSHPKRCFCTLGLQKSKQNHIPNVKSESVGTGLPNIKKNIPHNISNRNIATATKDSPLYYLQDGQCEPGVCIPNECDPYECLKRIKRRLRYSKLSGTDFSTNKSVFTYTKSTPGSRTKRAQANIRKYGQRRRRKINNVEKIKDEFACPSRQSLRLGSNMSFNIEFFKDGPPIGDFINRKMIDSRDFIAGKYQKISPNISSNLHKLKRHIGSQKSIRSETVATGMGKILKRCFCTLALRKKIKSQSVSKGTKTSNKVRIQEPVFYSENQMTMTDQFKSSKLEPYECAPKVCVPGECNPYECAEMIKKRLKHQREFCGGTDCPRTKCTSNNTGICTRSKAKRTQSNITGRSERFRRRRRRLRQCNDQDIVSDNENKHSCRIGSSINFNIEFYKDNALPLSYPQLTSNYNKRRKSNFRCKEDTCANFGNKRRTRTKSRESGYKIRHHSGGSQINNLGMKNTGTGEVRPFLQRCFCTLKLKEKRAQSGIKSVNHGTDPALIEETHKIRKSSKSTHTSHGYKLKPYECEPGICVPGDCDPYECKKLINKRHRQTKSVRFKSTSTNSNQKRYTLEPYECEPHVCIPGECDPYECEKRIKRRHLTESGRQSVGFNTIHKYKTKPTSTIKTKNYDKDVNTVNNLSVLRRCFCVLNLRKKRHSKYNDRTQKQLKTDSLASVNKEKLHVEKPIPNTENSSSNRHLLQRCFCALKQKVLRTNTNISENTQDLIATNNTHSNTKLKYNLTVEDNQDMETIMPYSKRKFSKHISQTKINKYRDNSDSVPCPCSHKAQKAEAYNLMSHPLTFFSTICKNNEKYHRKNNEIKEENKYYSECNKNPTCKQSNKSLGNILSPLLSKILFFCKNNNHKEVEASNNHDIEEVPQAPIPPEPKLLLQLDTKNMALRNMKKIENTENRGIGRSKSMKSNYYRRTSMRTSKSDRQTKPGCAQDNTCDCVHCSKMRSRYSTVNREEADIPIVDMLVNSKDMTLINRDEVARVVIDGKLPKIKKKAQPHHKHCQCCKCKKIKRSYSFKGINAYKKPKNITKEDKNEKKIKLTMITSRFDKNNIFKQKSKRILKRKPNRKPKGKPKRKPKPKQMSKFRQCSRILFGLETPSEKEKRLKRKISETERRKRKLMYKKEDQKRDKIRRKNDKKELRYVKKYRNRPGPLLVAESVYDISKLGFNTFGHIFRHLFRAARDPKDTYRQAQHAVKDPEAAAKILQKKMQSSGCCATGTRVKYRVKNIEGVKKIVKSMEERPVLNYMIHMADDDPKKRMKKIVPKVKKPQREPLDFGCSLYMASLRRRPVLAVYYACPWFYPHCLQMLTLLKQFTDILLFLLAVVAWSPCILCMEISRALMCCTFCTG